MCGASSQQKDIFNTQNKFYKQLIAQYKTTFGQSQQIYNSLTASFQPILEAGINQKGFSEGELTNLESQAVTGTGQNYAKAAAALGAQQGAEGGGTVYLPSGAKEQQKLGLAESAAQNESQIQSDILASDYATGRQNYLTAAGVLGGVASGLNPIGQGQLATSSGNSAAQTANDITNAQNSWMQLVSAGLGAAGTAAGGFLGKP